MSIARIYAKALLQAAPEANGAGSDIDQVDAQLAAIVEGVHQSAELRTALRAPHISAKEKIAIVDEVAKQISALPLVENFLRLLCRKGRIGLLPEIYEAFGAVRLELEGGTMGEVISADPLEQADIDGLAEAFTKRLGTKVAFRAKTDENLLAGMKVSVNGVTYDGSLRSKLQQLRERVVHGATTAH